MIFKIIEKDSAYQCNKLLEKANETNDMYSMGYTLLIVLGDLRQSSQPVMITNYNFYAEILKLCLNVVTGDVLARLSWLELLTQYEDIFLRHRIFRADPLEKANALPYHDYGFKGESVPDWSMRDLLRRLGAEDAKDWDLQIQIEKPILPSETNNTIFWDKFRNDPFYYDSEIVRSDEGQNIDLTIDRCLTYININLKTIFQKYNASFFAQYLGNGNVHYFWDKAIQTFNEQPWIFVDTVEAIVSVFWPSPQSVAWVWGFQNLPNTDGSGALEVSEEIQNNILENIN